MTLATLDPAAIAAAQQVLLAHWAAGVKGTTTKGVVSTTPRTTGYAHGNGGLLSAPGMSRDIINAMMLPHLGLQKLLPDRATNEQNPLYGIITGQTASSAQPSGATAGGVCDDPPMAGLLKLCSQSYILGRQSMQTPVFELDRLGMTTNRGEMWDFNLVGNPFDGNSIAPTVPGNGGINNALNDEIGKAMFELATAWTRDYARFIYTGNPSNNSGGGIIKEYRGLNGLINTGYRDAESGVACPRADSLIRSFNSANVRTNGANIVTAITGMWRQLKFRAIEMGLMPVRWVLAMRWSAFYELTEIWPCAYLTYQCQANASAATPFGGTAQEQMALRDGMRGDWDGRTGQYLLINGEKVPVVIDDAITETSLGNGAFNSDIYFVPLTVRGGLWVTYMEHVDYNRSGGFMDGARALAPDGSYFTTDGGRFAWHRKPPANFCVQALVKTEPRLILRTPQLAARLTNVAYTPWQHEDEAFTTPGYYFVNGGRTDRLGYGPSFFSPNTNVG